MPIRLPIDAQGHDYEDQVCSVLLANGNYLETRLILKKGAEEVLEFDAIATPVNDHHYRQVIEAKSGKWGMGDLFKLYGQAMYTSEQQGCLIHKKPASESKKEAISELSRQVPVRTIKFDFHSNEENDEMPCGLEIPPDTAQVVFTSSWWARSGERLAQSKFKEWIREQDQDQESIWKAREYLNSLDECLFKQTPLLRVNALYDAYKEAPQVTTNLMEYVADTSRETLKNVRQTVVNKDHRPHLQYVMAQECRARIAIIKNAYDAILEEASTEESKGKEFTWENIVKALLPESFKDGMDALRSHPEPEKVPFFYQVFVDVFGGFYFQDDAREMEALSSATGVAVENIRESLDLLDSFFPIKNGWIHDGDGISFLKGVPAYLRGAGCFARKALYGEEWKNEFPKASWQATQWHNALYNLLEPKLKVEE